MLVSATSCNIEFDDAVTYDDGARSSKKIEKVHQYPLLSAMCELIALAQDVTDSGLNSLVLSKVSLYHQTYEHIYSDSTPGDAKDANFSLFSFLFPFLLLKSSLKRCQKRYSKICVHLRHPGATSAFQPAESGSQLKKVCVTLSSISVTSYSPCVTLHRTRLQ